MVRRGDNEGVELIWEAPPEGNTRASIFDPLLEEVKKRPGSWARIRLTNSPGAAYNSRKNLIKRHLGDERWEFITRRHENDSYGVYARYRTPEQMEAAKRKR